MDNYTIEADRFGATMQQILGDLADQVDEGSGRAVRKAAQKGRKETKAKAPRRNHEGTHYAEGWTYRVKQTPEGWAAEIGNKDKPGLAHLLEKGHARVGGGRVDGREHIAPAADAAFDELLKQVQAEVDSL